MVPYTYKDTQWVGYEDADSLQIKMNWLKMKGYKGAMTWAIDMDDFQGLCGEKNPLIKVLHDGMKDYIVPESTMTTTPRPEWARPPSTKATLEDTPDLVPTTRKSTTVRTTKKVTTSTSTAKSEAPASTEASVTQESTTKKKKKKKKTKTTTTTMPTTPMSEVTEAKPSDEMQPNNVGAPDCTKVDPEMFYMDPSDCSKFFRCAADVAVSFTCEAGLFFNGQVCDWPNNVNRDECKKEELNDDIEDETRVEKEEMTTVEVEVFNAADLMKKDEENKIESL